MRIPHSLLTAFGLGFLAISPLEAQSDSEDPSKRYFEILLKRPESAPLFDRFYESWLENSTVLDLERFLQARLEDEESVALLRIRALVLKELSREEEAITDLERAVELQPENARTLLELARMQARLQKADEALKTMARTDGAASEGALSIEIAELRGMLLLRQGKSDQALEIWRSLMEANPDDDELQEEVIDILEEEGQIEEAITATRRLIDQTEDVWDRAARQFRLADLLSRSGQRSDALEIFRGLLASSGHDTWLEREVLARIQTIFRQQDATEDQRAFLQELKDEDPQRIAVRRELAMTLARLRDEKEAIQEFRQLLAITPGNREIREDFVNLLATLKQYDQAAQEASALHEQYPEDPELLLLRARMEHWANDNVAASASVKEFLEAGEQEEQRFLRAARLLEGFRLPLDAEEIMREMLTVTDSWSAQEAMADFLYRNQQEEEALELWSALVKEPDLELVLRTARNATTRGHHQEAFDWLHAREGDYLKEPRFLERLVEAALQVDEFEVAEPLIRPWARMARTPLELEGVIRLASRLSMEVSVGQTLVDGILTESETATMQEICLAAAVLHQQRDTERAFTTLDSLMEREDLEAMRFASWQKASLHTKSRRFREAAEALEALAEHPGGKSTALLQKLVELQERAGQFEDALRWVREWKPLSPGNPQIWLKEAAILYDLGEVEEAFPLMRKGMARFETDERFPSRLANWFMQTGRIADAEQLFWRLLDDAEDDREKLTWIRRLHEAAEYQNSVPDLILRLEERKKQNRGEVAPLLALAEVYELEQDTDTQLQTLKEASLLDPANTELALSLARAQQKQGQWEAALATLENALEHDRTGRVEAAIPEVLFAADQPREALERVRRMLERGTITLSDVEQTAVALLQQSDFGMAGEFLSETAVRYPEEFRIQYLSGVLLEEGGEYEAAFDHFLQILNLTAADAKAGFLDPDEMDILPPGTRPIAIWWPQHATAYSYRQGAPGGRLFQTSLELQIPQLNTPIHHGNSAIQLLLPQDLKDARYKAISHVVKILAQLDEESRQTRRQQLLDASVTPLHLDLALSLLEEENPLALLIGLPDFVEENLDEPAIAGFAIWRGQGDHESTRKALRVIGEEWPELGARGALMALAMAEQEEGTDEDLQEFFELAMKTLPKAEDTSALPQSIIQVLSSDALDSLAEEDARALEDLALSRLNAIMQDLAVQEPEQFQNLSIQLMGVLHLSGDSESLARILELQMDSAPAFWTQFAHRANSSILPMIPGMPAGYPSLFRFPNTPHNSGFFLEEMPAGVGEGVEPQDLLTHLKHPALRLLLDYQLNQVDDPESYLPEEPSPATTALVSEILREREQPRAALKVLMRDAARVEEGWAIQWLDQAIVRIVSLEDDAFLKETAEAPIREAIDRMVALGVVDDLKPVVLEVMEDLDMVVEARRLRLAPSTRSYMARAARVSTVQYRPVRIMSPDVAMQTATRHMESGNVDAALATILPSLRTQLRSRFGNQNTIWQLREFLVFLKSQHDLKLRTLEAMEPATNASDIELATWGVLCESLDLLEQAESVYRGILQDHPDDDAIRVRLLHTQIRQEKLEEAGESLGELDDQTVNLLSSLLPNEYNDRISSLLHCAQIAESWLREADKEALDQRSGWVVQLVQSLTRDLYDSEQELSIRGIFTSTNNYHRQNMSPRSEEIAEELTARRDESLESLLSLLIERSPHGLHSFPISYRWNRERDLPVDQTDLEDLELVLGKIIEHLRESSVSSGLPRNIASANANALMVVSSQFHAPHSIRWGNIFYPISHSYGGYNPYQRDGQFGTFDSAAAHLLWKLDEIPRFEALLEELPESQRENFFQSLQKFLTLYQAPPAQFAETFIKVSGDKGQQISQIIQEGMAIRKRRDLDVDMTDAILELATSLPDMAGRSLLQQSAPHLAADLVQQENGPQQMEKLIREMATLIVGPESEWEKKFGEKTNSDVQHFYHCLMSITNYKHVTQLWILKYMQDQMPEAAWNHAQMNWHYGDYRGFPDEEKLRFLEGTILEDLANFHAIRMPLNQRNQERTMAMRVLKQINHFSEEEKAEFLETLPKDGFGADLIRAWAHPTDRAELLSKLFQREESEILELPQSQKIDLAFLYQELSEEARIQGEAPDWTQEATTAINQEELERFLALDKFKDLGVDPYYLDEMTSRMVLQSLRTGNTGAAALEAGIRLLQDARTMPNQRVQWTTDVEFLNSVWEQSMYEDSVSVQEGLSLTALALGAAGEEVMEMNHYRVLNPMQRWARQLAEEKVEPDAWQKLVIRELESLVEISRTFPELRILWPVFMDELHDRLSSENRKRLVAMRENEGEDLSEDLLEMLGYAIPTDERTEALSQLILETLPEESTALPLRLILAEHWIQESNTKPMETLVQIGQLLDEAWNRSKPVSASNLANYLFDSWLDLPDHSDSWKEHSAELLSMWQAATRRTAGHDASSGMLLKVISLHLILGDQASAMRDSTLHAARLEREWHEVFVLFLMHDWTEGAERILRKHGQTFTGHATEARYNEIVHEAAARLLPAIKDPDLKVIAQSTLAIAYDQNGTHTWPNRERRTVEAVRDFPDPEKLKAATIDKLLPSLTRTVEAVPDLEPWLLSWASRHDLAASLSGNNYYDDLNIWRALWQVRASRGELQRLKEGLELIQEGSSNAYTRALSNTSQAIYDAIRTTPDDKRLALIRKLLAFNRQLSTASAHLGVTDGYAQCDNLLLHLLVNEKAPYDEWMAGLTQEQRDFIHKECADQGRYLIQRAATLGKELPFKERMRFLTAMQDYNEQFQLDQQMDDDLFRNIYNYRLLKEEELVNPEVQKLAAALPRAGHAWAELAAYHEKKERFDETRELYQKAAAAATDEALVEKWKTAAGRYGDPQSFLSGKRVEDLAESDRDFDQITERMIVAALRKGDMNLALQIHQHASQLVRDWQESGRPWWNNFYNGWDWEGEMVSDSVQETQRMTGVAFAIKTWSDPKHGAAFSGYSNHYKLNVPTLSWFRNAEAGRYSVGRGMSGVFRHLKQKLGDVPSTYYAATCWEIANSLHSTNLRESIRWADSVSADDPLYALAREYGMAARLRILNSPYPFAGDAEPVPNPQAFREYYLAALQDESVHTGWKVCLAHHLLHREQKGWSDAFILEAMDLTLEGLNDDTARFTGFSFGEIVHFYSQLPMDNAWQETLVELNAAWRLCNEQNDAPKGMGLAYDPVDDAVLSVLEANLRAGNEDMVAELIEEFGESRLWKSSAAAVLFARYGRGDLLAEQMDRAGTDLSNHFEHRPLWDAALEAGLEEALAAVQSDDHRFLARMIVSAIPDAPRDDQEEFSGMFWRKQQIAKAFSEMEFSSEEIRDRALYWMASWYPISSRQFLDEELRAEAESIDAGDLAGNRSTSTVSQASIYNRGVIANAAAAGEVQPAIDWFQTVSERWRDNEGKAPLAGYTAGIAVKGLRDGLRLQYNLEGPESETIRPIVEGLMQIHIDTPGKVKAGADARALMDPWVVLVAHAGLNEEVSAWYQGLDESQKKQVRESLGRRANQIYPELRMYLNRQASVRGLDEVPLDDRLTMVKSIQENAVFRAGMMAPAEQYSSLLRANIFTLEELTGHVEELAAQYDRDGKAWRDAADIFCLAGDADKAIALYQKSRDEAATLGMARGILQRMAFSLMRYFGPDVARPYVEELKPLRDELGSGGNKELDLMQKFYAEG